MVLLEVLLSIAMFALAAGVVAMSMRASINSIGRMRVEAEAADRLQTVLARVDTGQIPLAEQSATPVDEKDERWTYEIATDTVDDSKLLKRVRVTVRCAGRSQAWGLVQWMLDPAATADVGQAGGEEEVMEP